MDPLTGQQLPQALAVKLPDRPRPRFYEDYLSDTVDLLQPSGILARLLRELMVWLGAPRAPHPRLREEYEQELRRPRNRREE